MCIYIIYSVAFLDIIGTQSKTLLKPLNTISSRCLRGFIEALNWASVVKNLKEKSVREENLTDNCTPNRLVFPAWRLLRLSLRVSEANEVPISSHIWVTSTTFKQR